MQIQSVETSAGTEICDAPLLQESLNVFDGDSGIVDQDADCQRQSPKRHGVDRFAY